jgi:enhancer of polycomb-like protein
MTFPPFSDYQETFSSKLLPSTFASFAVPSWIPEPSRLSAMAQVVYPHWRERRLERNGHRIIPALNVSISLRLLWFSFLLYLQYDEADMKNESYICFRRREVKTVRKTRASQVSLSDKLHRLQAEMSVALELAQSVLQRENIKQESAQLSEKVWQKRVAFVDLKRKHPTIVTKEDEELLVDKERVVKKIKVEVPQYVHSTYSRNCILTFHSRRPKLTISRPSEIATPVEAAVRPLDRYNQIQAAIERQLVSIKEKDQQAWEDGIDVRLPFLSPPFFRRSPPS